MKAKIFQILTFSIKMFLSLFLVVVSFIFIISSVSNIFMTKKVKDFIASATFEEQVGDIRYYYIECDDIDVDSIDKENPYYGFSSYPALGNPGNIFILPQSRMEYFPLFSPFISYVFGGHAGLVVDNDKLVEAMGGTLEEGYVYLNISDLYHEERSVIGLKVDGTDEEIRQAIENAYDKVGDEYNYLFLFGRENKYYCIDICARVYSEGELDVDLDKTDWFTTVQELFVSMYTDISFFKYEHNGITYVYYLKSTK